MVAESPYPNVSETSSASWMVTSLNAKYASTEDEERVETSRSLLKSAVSAPRPTVPNLIDIRRRAIRKGVWFGTLTSLQQGVVNLTIRCVIEIKSSLLARTLQSIYIILSNAIAQGYLRRFFAAGKDLAEHLSDAAYSWGNQSALMWRFDKAYIICLGMNRLSGWSYGGR